MHNFLHIHNTEVRLSDNSSNKCLMEVTNEDGKIVIATLSNTIIVNSDGTSCIKGSFSNDITNFSVEETERLIRYSIDLFAENITINDTPYKYGSPEEDFIISYYHFINR